MTTIFTYLKLFVICLFVLFSSSCNLGVGESSNSSANSANLEQTNEANQKIQQSSRFSYNSTNPVPSANLVSWPKIGVYSNDNNTVTFCYQSSFPLDESKSCFSKTQLNAHAIDLKIFSINGNPYLYYVSQNPSQIMICQINSQTESFSNSDCSNAFSNPSELSNINSPRAIEFSNKQAYILAAGGIYRCQLDSLGKINNCVLDFSQVIPGGLVISGNDAYITAGAVPRRGIYHCNTDNNGSLSACNSVTPVILPGLNSNPYGLDLAFGNLFIANNYNLNNSNMPQVLKCPVSIRDGSFSNNDCTELPIIKQSGVSTSQIVTTMIASDGVIVDITAHDDINGGQIRTQCYITPGGDVCLGSNPPVNLAGPIPPNPESGFFNIIDVRSESKVVWNNLITGGNTICTTIKDSTTQQLSLYCWGNGTTGQLGPIGYGLKSAYPIPIDNKYFNNDIMDKYAVGYGHMCAAGLDKSGLRGKVYCWGENVYSQSGISKTGNSDYVLTNPNEIPLPQEVFNYDVSQIVAGGNHTCMILGGGDTYVTYCLGLNDHGQLGINSSITSVNVPTLVAGNIEFKELSAGYAHTCGIDINHDAWCFGDNYYGQLGNGNNIDSKTPVKITSEIPSNWNAITAGTEHTCALDKTGQAFCFGNNENGQLGDGTTINSNIPVPVQTDVRFAQIVAGEGFSCGLTEDNQVYCWGFGGLGTIGNGETKTINTLPVLVRLPLQSFGDSSQSNGSEKIIELDAGNLHICGLTNLGHIYCWGANSYYQLGKNSIRYQPYPELLEVVRNLAFAEAAIACSAIVLVVGYYQTSLWWIQQRINVADLRLRILQPPVPNAGNQNMCVGH